MHYFANLGVVVCSICAIVDQFGLIEPFFGAGIMSTPNRHILRRICNILQILVSLLTQFVTIFDKFGLIEAFFGVGLFILCSFLTNLAPLSLFGCVFAELMVLLGQLGCPGPCGLTNWAYFLKNMERRPKRPNEGHQDLQKSGYSSKNTLIWRACYFGPEPSLLKPYV